MKTLFTHSAFQVCNLIKPMPEILIEKLVSIMPSNVEYKIKVLDPGYETFLLTQKLKEFYSVSSLKVKNAMMVSEWNYRYSQPLHYNPDIYEVKIDYEANRYYGLEFEYRLYMFFKFMEKEYQVTLLSQSTSIVL